MLYNLSAEKIESHILRWEQVVHVDKPTPELFPGKLTLRGDLKKWRKSGFFLVNLYAASHYHTQLKLLRGSGDVHGDTNKSASRTGLTKRWKFEFIEASERRKTTTNGLGKAAPSSEGFDRSETNMIEGFAKRVQAADTLEDRADAILKRIEAQVEAEATGAATRSPNGRRSAQMARTRRAMRPAPTNTTRSQRNDPGSGIETSPTSSKERSKAVQPNNGAVSQRLLPRAATGNLVNPTVESFVDHRGQQHFRTQTGRFTKKTGHEIAMNKRIGAGPDMGDLAATAQGPLSLAENASIQLKHKYCHASGSLSDVGGAILAGVEQSKRRRRTDAVVNVDEEKLREKPMSGIAKIVLQGEELERTTKA